VPGRCHSLRAAPGQRPKLRRQPGQQPVGSWRCHLPAGAARYRPLGPRRHGAAARGAIMTTRPASVAPAILPGLLRQLSDLLYRKPTLYLSLLLIPPLLWFGIVYLGSLLALLWQGFYTFDDFTMSVTPALTLANFRALFHPANFDIIQRTQDMAMAVSLARALLALPFAFYMARYTTGRIKAFFYIAVMLPMWASYIVKAYAWTLLLRSEERRVGKARNVGR